MEQPQNFKNKKELKRKKRQEKLIKEGELHEAVKRAKVMQEEQDKTDKEKPRFVSTVSIAVPGSILENAQSPELRTYLAGQIARAACIYNIDEVIVFDDQPAANVTTARMASMETAEGVKVARPCCIQLARILQYLECPQYLRKFFFPIHHDLKFSGLLNPLDSQHHLRVTSEFTYREGIVTNKPHPKGAFVNAGLMNDVLVNKTLQENLRVTVKLPPTLDMKSKKLKGKIVSPSEPRRATGIYWGYNVRIANSISQVFSQSPYRNGYDVTIGTSDKGENIHNVENKSVKFNHLLIVFGGLFGLENAIENDETMTVDDPSLLFDHYFNVVPEQGSRTVRTEEAVLITLSTLGDKIEPIVAPPEFKLKDLIAQSEDTGNLQKFGEPMKRKNNVLKKRERKPVQAREATEATEASGESDNNVSANDGGTDDNDMSRFD